MRSHKTTYRVIYGDTDNMGIVYNANYLRCFEIGRTEYFRDLGLTYREIEEKGIRLPLSEAKCKYLHPARYDDLVVIVTSIDTGLRGGIKFDYRIYDEQEQKLLAKGYTKHACLNSDGKVSRPPRFLVSLIQEKDLD